MSKVRAYLLSGAAALSLTLITHASAAQDDESRFVARDASGDIRVQDDEAGFGRAGQWTFSTDTALSFSRTTFSDEGGASSTLSILPATDYFIIENLSLGGVIGVEYTKAGSSRATTFRIGPRVGYNFEFSRLLSLWPKLGFSYAYNRTKVSGYDADDNNALQLNLFAPLMVHPAPHFFAGFGPFLDTDLNGDNRTTTWGFKLTLGGWL